MKGKFLALAIGGAMLALAGMAGDAFAKPPFEQPAPEVGKQLWKFNVIALPATSGWSNGDHCNGAKMFFRDDTKNLGTISWYFDPAAAKDFEITDCDATDGAGSVMVDGNTGNVIVAVRLVGPKTSTLTLVCEDGLNGPNGELDGAQDLCLLDDFNLAKSKNFTKIMQKYASEEFEGVLWTLSGDWKIFDVRVFELLY